jgi:hypothetical protein
MARPQVTDGGDGLWIKRVTANIGLAIAQAVSRWLPNAAARVQTRV